MKGSYTNDPNRNDRGGEPDEPTPPTPAFDPDPVHLGDGAYVSRWHDGIVLTANDHDPDFASDRVYIDAWTLNALERYIDKHFDLTGKTQNRAVIEAEVVRERNRCIAIARGCKDYKGGHDGELLEAFWHGVDTVVNALSAQGDTMQVRVLEAIGREDVKAEVAGLLHDGGIVQGSTVLPDLTPTSVLPVQRFQVRDPAGTRFTGPTRESCERFLQATGAQDGKDGVSIDGPLPVWKFTTEIHNNKMRRVAKHTTTGDVVASTWWGVDDGSAEAELSDRITAWERRQRDAADIASRHREAAARVEVQLNEQPLAPGAQAGTHPTLSAMLDVLADLDEECLVGVYDIDPESRADLDRTVYAWRKAGCPR